MESGASQSDPKSHWLARFRRVTSSGDYLPELDGLRFVAITMVVVFHAWGYFNVHGGVKDSPVAHAMVHSVVGLWATSVQLFFVISGFILGVPFARHALQSGPRVVLKRYFLRRLSRLEPPYIVAMLVLFAASIAIGKYTFTQLWPSLLASLVYLHNIVFQKGSLITVVAWSLEIEVQFYILAPVIALVFRLERVLRRSVLVVGVLGLPFVQRWYDPPFQSLYDFLQYFLAGFLLADLYLSAAPRERDATLGPEPRSPWWCIPAGMLLLAGVLCMSPGTGFFSKLVYPLVLLGFCYFPLFFGVWRRAFSNPWLSTIGGMCYSIYLFHFALISMFGRVFVRIKPFTGFFSNFAVHLALQLAVVLSVSAVFFYFIEKPCMRRGWYKDLFSRGRALVPESTRLGAEVPNRGAQDS